ncbi:DUF1553 domain-containing protein [Allorhodopirellula solitaria]|uniref:Planctomycete cytochrome C n=1 Tax=Allorhodopirellula solitaria TaxID=2527987 RepID=A0A5C5YDH7_9BACT|nr:DUF1553 domain-containing protein [Allorhodopirellula solitaria]TWT73410.1 Planctomycete cytochrome C [Allorhodopirellula solitaria]
MLPNLTIPFALLLGTALWSVSAFAGEIDFNREIRPILSENCFYCHGQDPNHREADLRLDVRQDALDYGAFEPGDAEASVLIERVLSDDPDMLMPPPDANRTLTDAEKALLRQWVDEGAEYQQHWAFVAPVRPAVPSVTDPQWARNAIDFFVLSKLEENGWQPSPPAERATLIKRLYADMLGLPPTPEEVDQFVHNDDPGAYDALVERLLASPHYGERMALPWLDAARYADSNGFQQDGDTWQWMWRDWVVDAINEDMPFDQFTIEQLAGDLLPDATTDQKIASGFNRNHLLNGEGGAIAEEQRFNILFDRIDTTTTNWLGLTVACAQCHDHKYDPISQKDYYRLLDAFNRVPENGRPQRFSSRIRVGNPVLELPTAENKERISEFQANIAAAKKELDPLMDAAYEGWRLGLGSGQDLAQDESLPESLRTKLEKPKGKRSEEEKQAIEKEWRSYFQRSARDELAQKTEPGRRVTKIENQLAGYRGDQIPRPMVMSDDKPRDTHVLDRGAYLSPLEKVTFDTPAFLPPLPDDAPKNRLGFARWLMADTHPLTARVQVNRMWQHSFGMGIVKTSEDFGVQSEFPVHQDLLDWMAVEFRASGWSRKHVHRLIVTSSTYRQSSRMTEKHRTEDIENRLIARATRIRMPSMVLRDWALASAGLLDDRIGGHPVYPYQPDAVWEALAITKERDFTYPASTGGDLYRRSLYTFWRRTVAPTNMFDASDRQACRVRAAATITPLHALTTLNDPTWIEAARVLAGNCLVEADELRSQLQSAFESIACRTATDSELRRLEDAYQKQFEGFRADPAAAIEFLDVGKTSRDTTLAPVQHAAMTAVCLAIFNLDESLTRE